MACQDVRDFVRQNGSKFRVVFDSLEYAGPYKYIIAACGSSVLKAIADKHVDMPGVAVGLYRFSQMINNVAHPVDSVVITIKWVSLHQ